MADAEAVTLFSSEHIYKLFLCVDHCWRSIAELWYSPKPGEETRWAPILRLPSTPGNRRNTEGEAATAAVSEFAASLAVAGNLLPACLYALGMLRDGSVFTDRVVLGGSPGHESPEETLAFVELTSRSATAIWYASTISYNPTELRRLQLQEKSKSA